MDFHDCVPSESQPAVIDGNNCCWYTNPRADWAAMERLGKQTTDYYLHYWPQPQAVRCQ